MLHVNSFRRPGLLLIVALFVTGVFNACLSQSPNYEAAKWNTWFLDDPDQITIPAPPIVAQLKIELQAIKQRVSKLDKKQLAEIKYWNAGAPAHRWNQIAPKLISYDRFDILARTPTAWMNLAIYDATVLAWRAKVKYKAKRPHDIDPSIKTAVDAPATYSYPCEHTVTAAAAATVLAYFFPEKGDSILQLAHAASQSRINAGLQFQNDVDAGWKLGEAVAKQIIEKAKKDGATMDWKGPVNKDPKRWTGSFPMGITLSLMKPLVLNSANQFRPAPPPDFEADMSELKKFKRNFSSNSLAYYWANNGGYDYWSDLAAKKMFENRVDDAPSVARVYAVLHIAYHDVVIAIFDAKYTYWGIRPDQYDSTYKALIQTPPFPGYPSGHAAGSSTTATVLEYFFPADAKELRKLAKDCADSRFFAGIHFRTDNEVGTAMGKELGMYIAETLMKK
jgi:membrane-associated phospholipid phosphatase